MHKHVIDTSCSHDHTHTHTHTHFETNPTLRFSMVTTDAAEDQARVHDFAQSCKSAACIFPM